MKAVDLGLFRGHAQHDVFADGQRFIQLRFLRQIADLGALGGPCFTGEVGVEAGHDLHQRRFTRAVDADDTDFHAGQKAQVDVFKALLATGIGLGDTLHVVDILIGGHVASSGSGKLG